MLLTSGKGAYQPLDMNLSNEDAAGLCRRILQATKAQGWQLGRSRVFLRAGQLAFVGGKLSLPLLSTAGPKLSRENMNLPVHIFETNAPKLVRGCRFWTKLSLAAQPQLRVARRILHKYCPNSLEISRMNRIIIETMCVHIDTLLCKP